MEETLTEQATHLLSQMITDAASVREFVIEQTPDVIQQLLMWHFWMNSITSILFFALFAVLSIATYKVAMLCINKKKENPKDDWDIGIAVSLIIGVPASLGTVMPFCIRALEALKLTIAPKVWLLEYASELVK